LSTWKNGTFDLIILDLMLPGVTGESILQTIRETDSIPILVLTAVQDKAKTAALLTAGANDYLTKPFDIGELKARVAVQLRSRQPQQNKLHVGTITLNLRSRETLVADHPISLARKEFDLLAHLMAQPHRVFSKEELYNTVWHEDYLGAENTLNVHLSHLRTKLNADDPQANYIQSVWGIGVRFE
jgi:DNA-binding response OmpR family regulator